MTTNINVEKLEITNRRHQERNLGIMEFPDKKKWSSNGRCGIIDALNSS